MHVQRSKPITVTLFVFLVALPLFASTPEGSWKGAIEIPGRTLEISVELSFSNGAWAGTISIPAQNAKDLPLENVNVDAAAVTFAIGGVPGQPTFRGMISEDGSSIAGDFSQGGATFPFALTSADVAADKAAASLEGLADEVASGLERFEVPGVAIGIVKGDEVLLAEGYGMRDVEGNLPVTADTLFPIGSSTKAFTTMTLGTLVDEGRLDWDRPVREYLQRFALANDYMTTHVTPRDLVTHRSGYPRHDLVWYNNQDLTRTDLVARLEHLEPNAELREKFQYNNLMFLTAGHLIETITGKSWEDAVRERILTPLGMTRTTFADADSVEDADHALPYAKRDDVVKKIPFREVGNMGPAGSINSSAREMTNWLLLNLGGGTFDGKRIVQASTLTELQTPQMHIGALPDEPETGPMSYAMGWFVDTYRGHLRLHHGGNIDGFSALVVFFPHDGLGIVVLTNMNGTPLTGLLARHVADRVLELERRDWLSEAHAEREQMESVRKEAESKKESVRIEGTSLSHPIDAFAGRYHDEGYGDLLIEKKGDGLGISYNGITAPLEHWHYDVFNATENADDPAFEDLKVSFETDFNGNVAVVKVPFEPLVDPIVFTKLPPAWMSDPVELGKLTGDYVIGPQTISISLKGETLVASIPGQPSLDLDPELDGWFNLGGLTGFRVRFVDDKLEISQPNGLFTATRKAEE